MKISVLWAAFGLALCVAAAPVWAEKADMTKSVYLNAANVRVDDARKVTVFEGGAVLTRGSLQITADRIEATQDAAGIQTGVAFGKPAHFRQKEEGTALIIEGWAERIDYDGRAEIVKLKGQARVKRGDQQEMHGDNIVYNMRSQVYQADGGVVANTAGRVIVVIPSKAQPAPELAPAVTAPMPAKTIPVLPIAPK
ncbi:MAG: lipopolysaccharide transport periplasmic protein LptA [Betaproteobacteria bacterium]|nr:MAG: lipopolysaccharide transport periplasmic protein LptA [Betaproteobacteria bacterium]